MDEHKRYCLYQIFSGVSTYFDDPALAAEAFYSADASERPCVFYGNAVSSRKVTSTMRMGRDFVKAMPFETDPEFADAYIAIQDRELK